MNSQNETAYIASDVTSRAGRRSVLHIFEPGSDGVFRHVEKLIEVCWTAGYTVHIAYSTVRGSKGLLSLVREVESRGGQALDMRTGPIPSLKDISVQYRLSKFVRRIDPNVVHCHSSKGGALGRLSALFCPRAAFFYTPNAYFGMNKRKTLKIRFFNAIETMLSRVGTTINVSRDEFDFATSVLGLPTVNRVIIANPVDASRFTPATMAEKCDARRSLNLPPGRVLMGFASRYAFQKDPETAYRAFAKVCASNPDVDLVHLCKISSSDQLLRLAANLGISGRIHFVDYMEDVRDFYRSLDVFLLTSVYEAGWPFVVLEAMAMGLPLVSSLALGMSDFNRSGLTHGYSFPVGDVDAAATAMLRGCSAQIENCNHRKIAIDRFSVEICFGSVLSLYEKSMETRFGEPRLSAGVAAKR